MEMKETMTVFLEIGLVHNIRAVTSEGDRLNSSDHDRPLAELQPIPLNYAANMS